MIITYLYWIVLEIVLKHTRWSHLGGECSGLFTALTRPTQPLSPSQLATLSSGFQGRLQTRIGECKIA